MCLADTPAFEGHVYVSDVALYTRQYGVEGPPVVLIHGGPDWDHTYFLPFVLPLARVCRLTLFDMRGCGRSTLFHDPARYTVDAVVDDLLGLLRALRLDAVTLLGFSFGGRVALRFTDRYPQIVHQLILASTTAYEDFQDDLERWPDYQARYTADTQQAIRAILESVDLSPEEKTRRLAFASACLDVYDECRLPAIRHVLGHISFSGEWMRAWREGLLKQRHHPDYGRRLAELALPLAIVHGEKDMRFPFSVAQRLHASVPGSTLSCMPQTGHLAHIESTAAWNDAVIRALKLLPGDAND